MAVGYTNILIFILRKITLMMLVLNPRKRLTLTTVTLESKLARVF